MRKEKYVKGWLVREPVIGDYLSFFRSKPVKLEHNHWIDKYGEQGAHLADYKHELFSDIKTETGPIRVELTITRI